MATDYRRSRKLWYDWANVYALIAFSPVDCLVV